MATHINVDTTPFRSQGAIQKQLADHHNETMKTDKEKRIEKERYNLYQGSLFAKLNANPLPTNCKLEKQNEIANNLPGCEQDFNPTFNEAKALLKANCDKQVGFLMTAKDSASNRLAVLQTYNKDLRTLEYLAETGKLRLEIS